MRKDATYKEKFKLLQLWIPLLISSVKKDLKNEHLKQDARFSKQYLGGKNLNKLSDADLTLAYQKAIEESENGEAIAEFIAQRWLLKHGDLYHFFEERLRAINPQFTELELLSLEHSQQLSAAAVAEFGPLKTYLFAVLNSVVFPESLFSELGRQATQNRQEEAQREEEQSQKISLEKLQQAHVQQLARLTDKYEKKLSGLQKKYTCDTEALKKQLSQLQRKLESFGRSS